MSETVTVFVRLIGGAFPGVFDSDVRVYKGEVPPGLNFALHDWARFNEVPVQPAPTLATRSEQNERQELERMNRFADRGEKYIDDQPITGDTT